jgi:peptidylprolyl isomerase
MPSSKHRRQAEAARRARRAAAAEAARRQQYRRQRILGIAGAVLVAVVVAGLVIAAVVDDDDSQQVATDDVIPTTASTAAPESAAGKPCVPSGELPAGAPAVPVREGPPPTELVKEDLQEGSGAAVTESDTITVNYVGVSCSTGVVFDSSWGEGREPATFPLSNVIPGWQQGIPGMKVGGRRLLGIPPELAYGETGSPPDIAPDETLWFVVELLSIGEPTPTSAPG